MSEVIHAYDTITASSEFREKERLRAKARHDEAQALHHAKREEKLEMAQKLMDMDLPFEQIMKVTGLTRADLESLRTKI